MLSGVNVLQVLIQHIRYSYHTVDVCLMKYFKFEFHTLGVYSAYEVLIWCCECSFKHLHSHICSREFSDVGLNSTSLLVSQHVRCEFNTSGGDDTTLLVLIQH